MRIMVPISRNAERRAVSSFSRRGVLLRSVIPTLFAMSLLIGTGCPLAAAAPTPSDSAAAQALFDQAKALMAKGNYQEACPKLEESQRLDPTSGTLINLADCYEKTSKLASAWSTFLDAATAADASGKTERAQVARERAAALVPVLPRLAIVVPEDAAVPGMEIVRDRVVVGRPQWGEAIPTDPGTHQVTASAPRKQSWSATVEVPVEGQTVTLTIPPLEDSGDSAAKTDSADQKPGHAPPPGPILPRAAESSPPLGTQHVLALVAGGLGLVGVGVGSVYGAISLSKSNEADKYCDGSGCRSHKGVDLRDDALSAGNVSTVAFIVGAVGLAGGAALWFTVPPSEEMATAPSFGICPGTIVAKGSW